jgi:exodeoxyribonuclease V beta subunit
MIATDELPGDGLKVIEASAGTGKTHRLSTLAARWLVERDLATSGLLVVTYTIAAARELRARVRERLVEVHAVLTDTDAPVPEDLAWCDGPAGRDVLAARAERALAGFDELTISTIHAFAAAALGGSLRAVDVSELRRHRAVGEVLALAAFDAADPLLESPRAPATLDATVARALDNPDAELAPAEGATADATAWAHVRAVERAIARFEERGRRAGVHTYADLITDLHAGLADDDSPLLATLRGRYLVGLIDEFQDTDPFQWEIFRRIFLDAPGRTLVVVGDPKQAIYGFRGADVDTYLAARRLAEAGPQGTGVESLARNYRSDRSLIRALNGLFDGATFDEPGAIDYVEVAATPDAPERSLTGGSSDAALSIRCLTWGTTAAEHQRAIAEDCADSALDALGSTVRTRSGDVEPVTEGDVAVLCRTRTQFPQLRAAFLRRGIRTTEARTDDVLESTAALDVAIALRAMAEPTNGAAVLAVAHSWLGAGGPDDGVGAARRRIAEWTEALDRRGVASFARMLTDPSTSPGLLARAGGERLLTDVQHVCEVLADSAPHGAGAVGGGRGPPGARAVQLLETLEELRATARASDDELRTRRIDTDEPAVRLMTVHGAKGLEFPIVLCPFLQYFQVDARPTTMWREPSRTGRMLDAAGGIAWTDPRLEAADRDAREREAASAEASELRRLLYVALTRAKHRTVVWFETRSKRGGQRFDELTWLLLDRDADAKVVRRSRTERSDRDATAYDLDGAGALVQLREQFARLVDDADVELVEVRRPRGLTQHAPGPTRVVDHEPAAPIAVSSLHRDLSERARRCSFSSLVAATHELAALDPLVGDGGADDEAPDGWSGEEPAGDARSPVRSDPFGGLRGPVFGSAVHEALEAALGRRRGTSYDEALDDGLAAALRRNGVEANASVLPGLLAASSARFGGGPSLRELATDDASSELRFQLPVADHVDVADVARVLLDAGGAGPFEAWARRLASEAAPRPLASALVGSIDLVSSLGHPGRFHVVDYKTNVSEPFGYAPDALLAVMSEADYPLQALLYLVALHRMLRWRIRDYDPTRHLGSAHYLFLRGMRPGSDDGVVTWSPGARAVSAVSDLLAGAR